MLFPSNSVHLPLFSYGVGVWHKASVSGCFPLAAPIGLSPLLILTLCGAERVLVVSMEPLDDLSYLTTPGSAVPETGWGGGWCWRWRHSLLRVYDLRCLADYLFVASVWGQASGNVPFVFYFARLQFFSSLPFSSRKGEHSICPSSCRPVCEGRPGSSLWPLTSFPFLLLPAHAACCADHQHCTDRSHGTTWEATFHRPVDKPA